ncbi:MAG TPA: helix-turn-helix domain-containing protein [Candidatus Faecousia faecavium]|nr:helix-turn-helix domain-containing protein [Candidatus Faecousia faecavium]
MSFGSKLRAARKAKQLTQKELAAKIKAAHNSISNWENDQNMPDPDTIQNLCWALDVEPNYFFSVDSSLPLPRNIIPLPEMQRIPLLGSIACGSPILAEEHIEDYVDIPRNIHADFALTCKGDSMINARIFDGDIVYIRQLPSVDNGEIAAVLIDGDATLKRVRLFDDHISLEPENPMYKPLVFWGDEMNTVHILGKAVAFTSMIR